MFFVGPRKFPLNLVGSDHINSVAEVAPSDFPRLGQKKAGCCYLHLLGYLLSGSTPQETPPRIQLPFCEKLKPHGKDKWKCPSGQSQLSSAWSCPCPGGPCVSEEQPGNSSPLPFKSPRPAVLPRAVHIPHTPNSGTGEKACCAPLSVGVQNRNKHFLNRDFLLYPSLLHNEAVHFGGNFHDRERKRLI